MLNWIAGFVARWTPVVSDAVRDLVHWCVHALASVVYTVFGNVGKAWAAVVHSADWILHTADEFVRAVWSHIWVIITKDIPYLWAYLLAQLKSVGHLIAHIYALAVGYAFTLYHLALHAVDALDQWVLTHVLLPLTSITTSLRNDLLKWGYFAYQLLNNPAKLAGILAHYMVSAVLAIFWDVAGLLGEFAAMIILRNTKRILSVIETVLAAVL